jgi:hypothetical protein
MKERRRILPELFGALVFRLRQGLLMIALTAMTVPAA